MPRALIINPNTSATVTALLVEHARRQIGGTLELSSSTARFGASYIASEAAFAIAGHAVLDCWAQDGAVCEAILIGCFGDPGLAALREVCPVPVVGLAQASMREAAQCGRFAIVTGGPRWQAILRRLAIQEKLQQELADILVLPYSGAELAADPGRAVAVLSDACRRAADATGADAIVLGGAALAGLGDTLAQVTGLPIIDSVSAGLRALLDAARRSPGPTPPPDGAHYSGLSQALCARLDGDTRGQA